MILIHSNFNMVIAKGGPWAIRTAVQKRDQRFKTISTHFNDENIKLFSTPRKIAIDASDNNKDLIFSDELSSSREFNFVFSKTTQTEARIFALLGYNAYILDGGEFHKVEAKGDNLYLANQVAMVLNQSLNGHFKDINNDEVIKKVSKEEANNAALYLAEFVKRIKIYDRPVKAKKQPSEKKIDIE